MIFQPCPPPHDLRKPCATMADVDAMLRTEPFEMIATERLCQQQRWGDQSDLHPGHLLSILTEEVGEAAHDVNELLRGERDRAACLGDLYKELMQIAAVSIQMMEIVQKDLQYCILEEQAARRMSPSPTAAAMDVAEGRI